MLNSHDEDIGALIEVLRKANGSPKLEKLVDAIQQRIYKLDNGLDIIAEELRRYEMALRRIIYTDGAGAEIGRGGPARLRNGLRSQRRTRR